MHVDLLLRRDLGQIGDEDRAGHRQAVHVEHRLVQVEDELGGHTGRNVPPRIRRGKVFKLSYEPAYEQTRDDGPLLFHASHQPARVLPRGRQGAQARR